MTTDFRLSDDFAGLELSHATMRPEDLIPCFLSFLASHAPQAMPADAQYMGLQYLMQTDTGAIDTEDGWYDTFLHTTPEAWGGEDFEDSHLVPVIRDHDGGWREGDYWSEQASDDTFELFCILDSIAPEGCYFGALEGDGSCYGFWPCEDDDAYPLFIVNGN